MSHTMTHVGHGPPSASLSRQDDLESAKPYKVVFENITQEKKQLQMIDSHHHRPPHGYTYVPFGYPDITEGCKEHCRQQGMPVYTKSDHYGIGQLARQVGRIGFHFPTEIVGRVHNVHGSGSRYSGIFQTKQGPEYRDDGVVNASQIERRLNDHARRLRSGRNMNETQIQIGQVKSTIQELFPKIPEIDLQAITDRAFAEGAKTVGNERNMPLAQRVQLAVGAHARHTYTHYDQLLKVVDWDRARSEIQKEVLDVLLRWRGENIPENNATELEDILREVIVIDSDDEGEEREDEEYEPPETLAQPQRESDEEYVPAEPSGQGAGGETLRRPNHYGARGDQVPHQPMPRGMPHERRENRFQAEMYRRVEESMNRHNLIARQTGHRPPQVDPDVSTAYQPRDREIHHVQNALPAPNFEQRPMFVSSARPEESHVYESIENGGLKKRRQEHILRSPAGTQGDRGPTVKRHRCNGLGPDTYVYSGDASSREFRHVDGEDLEVVHLRSNGDSAANQYPARLDRHTRNGHQHPIHDHRHQPQPQFGLPAYHAFYQQPYEQNGSQEPATHGLRPRRQQHIDAYTGQPVQMGYDYELVSGSHGTRYPPPPPPPLPPTHNFHAGTYRY